MTDTAPRFVDVHSTSSVWPDPSKNEWIDSALKRQARDESDAVDADEVYRDSHRHSTDFSALPDHIYESHQALLVFPRTKLRPRPNLVPLQEWEGCVIDITEVGFTARLVDMTRQEHTAAEEADFDFEDVSDPDRDLLREGAVFRWTIGYETAPSGSKKRVSQLVFRRFPKWTKKEIAQSDRNADELLNGIDWE